MKRPVSSLAALLALAGALTLINPTPVAAELLQFYIGSDGRAIIPTGTYSNLANPNFGRLTFLYAHTYPTNPANNHYHGIGVYSLTGPTNALGTNNTSGNRRIPETFSSQPPLPMTLMSTGAYAGKLVQQYDAGLEYSLPIWKSVATLDGFAPSSGEYVLFNSGGNAPVGRWTNYNTGSLIALELLSITPGLNIGVATNFNVLVNPGDLFTLGAGDSFVFEPHFWTDASSPIGTYSAEFRLKDLNGLKGDSGTFAFDFAVVPEPSTWALMSLGTAGLGLLSWRRRRH
jgi:hypothetical protein